MIQVKFFSIQILEYEQDIDELGAFSIFNRIIELGNNILRCECRLYPNLFPERTFSVSNSIMFDGFKMNKINPFKSIVNNLTAVQDQVNDSNQVVDNYIQV